MLLQMAAGSDSVLRKLADSKSGALARIDAVTELHDRLERYVLLSGYPIFLERSMPVLLNILRRPCIIQVQTNDQMDQQSLRNCSLQILRRLSTSPFSAEPFEPYAEETVDLLISLIRNDNEDNVILCMSILSNIVQHKHQKITPKLPSLLGLIPELFEHLEGIVREHLDNMPLAGAAESLSPPGSGETTTAANPVAMALKGMQSLKVLSECATFALSIFQAYEHAIPEAVKLLPLITAILSRQAKAQEQAHKDAAANGTIFTGVSPDVKNRAAFGEFIGVQVKVVHLSAYLLRASSELAASQQFKEFLPDVIIRLMKDCPGDRPETLKELLFAVRWIINFNFRKIFLVKIHDFLDERVLIGEGLTMYETSRPLAYSMLADLIHHVRQDLQPKDIHKIVEVYTKNLLDSFPGTSFQTMSLKLLLNMVEPITKKFDKVGVRHYLTIILNAMADKFKAINQQYSNARKLSKLEARPADGNVREDHLAAKKHPPRWDETDIFLAGPIKTSTRALDRLNDNRFLFKNLMSALKEILSPFKTLTDILSTEETYVILKLVREIPPGFIYGFSSEESENFVQTFWNTCQHAPAAKLREEIRALKALARDHSEQSLLQDAVMAIESFKWSASASDGCSAEIENDSDHDSDHDSKLGLYPEKFWMRFRKELGGPECCLIIEEVGYAESQALRDWGVSQVGDLLDACNCIVTLGGDTRFDAIIHTMKILNLLCSSKTIPWNLKEQHLYLLIEIAEQLEHFAKTDQLPPRLHLAAYQVTDLLELIFAKWLKQAPDTLDPLLRLIDDIATGKLRALPNLSVITYENILSSRPALFLNTVIHRCLEVYASKSTSQCAKWYLLRDIINPTVAMLLQRSWKQGNTNIDEAVIESIRSKIWKRGSLENLAEPRINHVDKEALQLTALLLQHHSTGLQHIYQDIIDFSVAKTQQNDATVKYAAYLPLAYCVALYKTTADLAIQTYLALLQCDSDQCPALVLQGLKLVAPVMPERCRQRLEDKNGAWAAGLRHVLAASDTSISHMATLLEFLNSQSKLFYHSRDEIAILAIDCLYKVAPPSNSSNQSRQLAMGVMRLLWGWEHRRVNSRWSLGWNRGSENQSVIPRMIEYLIEFLVHSRHQEFPSAKFAEKLPPVAATQPPSEDLHNEAMSLLFNLVQPKYWCAPDAGFPDILRKVLSSDETRATLATSDNVHVEKHTNRIINALQASCILVHFGSENWVAEHMVEILEVFRMCYVSKKPEVREQVRAAEECKIFKKIQRIVESKTFRVLVKEKAEEGCEPQKAWGFMGFILGLFWPWWMKPAKHEGRSRSLEKRSWEGECISEKLPVPE